jgi:transcriptional regulator with XRE-family HTH domain
MWQDGGMASGTLAEILAPYRADAIVEATGKSRASVSTWRAGTTLPNVETLPALAEFLRVDLAELTQIIAADSRRLAESRRAT